MSTTTTTFPRERDAERALLANADRLRRHEDHGTQLYAERRRIFRALLGFGRSRAAIGRLVGISGQAVTMALEEPANGRRGVAS